MTPESELPITTVVVEDEKPARERLLKLIRQTPRLGIVEVATDGIQAVECINRVRPELLFLDVQIPLRNGFEVLKCVDKRPCVIFTTAYDEYAIQAFDVHAVDYLLKPYSRERFTVAVERALSMVRNTLDDKVRGLLDDYQRDKGFLERVSVRKGHIYHVIPVAEVDYFKADGGLVFLHQADERYVIDTSLAQLEAELDPAVFLRIHRNALVNIARINRILPWGQGQMAVAFSGDRKLLVSRSHIEQFRRRMGLRL